MGENSPNRVTLIARPFFNPVATMPETIEQKWSKKPNG
jgi:hypothetical protein